MKAKFLAVIFIVLFFTIFLPAQEEDSTSDMYVRSISILKIYSHQLGFRVVYMKSNQDLADFFLPIQWVRQADGKAVLISGINRAYPYFSIFWKKAKFDHIKLYLNDNPLNDSWGVVDNKAFDWAAEFKKVLDSGDLKIEF